MATVYNTERRIERERAREGEGEKKERERDRIESKRKQEIESVSVCLVCLSVCVCERVGREGARSFLFPIRVSNPILRIHFYNFY